MSNTLNIHEAGALMNVHPDTVLKMIDKGVIPAGKVGRAYVMLTRDVMAHIEKIIVRQTAERMGAPKRRSPQARGQVAAPQIGVTSQHR